MIMLNISAILVIALYNVIYSFLMKLLHDKKILYTCLLKNSFAS